VAPPAVGAEDLDRVDEYLDAIDAAGIAREGAAAE
jgi:hypothetical protein